MENDEIFKSIEDPKIPGLRLIEVKDIVSKGKEKKVLLVGVPNNRHLDTHPKVVAWLEEVAEGLKAKGLQSVLFKNE